MRIGATLAAAACIVAFSTVAQGEVRIVAGAAGDSSIRAQVSATESGVWTPRGSVDARTLNPAGDAIGDGAPSIVHGVDSVLAAWTRSSAEQVMLAAGVAGGWSEPLAIDAPGIVGTPRVFEAGDSLVLLSQRLDDGLPSVHIQLVESSAITGDFAVDSAWLVNAWQCETGLVLLTATTAGDFVVYSGIRPPIEPIDWTRTLLDFDLRPELLSGWASAPPVLSRIESKRIRGEERSFLLTWLSPWQVVATELGSDGSVSLPSEERSKDEGGRPFPRSLVVDALKGF